MDASTSSQNNWQRALNFVNSVAGNLTVNATCARVAVIRYADHADTSIALDSHSDIASLQTAVRSLKPLGRGHNLTSALRVLRSRVFSEDIVRSGATLVAAVVTDQQSCSRQLLQEANELKSEGVIIVGVAITQPKRVDISCLRQVVTSNQLIGASKYNSLKFSNVIGQTVKAICVAPTSPRPAPSPSFSGKFITKFTQSLVMVLVYVKPLYRMG